MRVAVAVGWWRIALAKKAAQAQFVRRINCPPLLPVDSPETWKVNPGTSSHFSAHPASNFSANEQMGAKLDGKLIANDLKSRIACEVSEMKKTIGKTPGLGIVLVGERRDSHTFIHTKVKACNKVGIVSAVAELPSNSKEDDICDAVLKFNDNPSIHGIIVQLPLPKHLDEEKIMNIVSVEKDVDGFPPLNMGNLAITGRTPLFIPCAAKACLELLVRYGVGLRGKKAVVVGRSKIVGLPTCLLLQRHHATVSLVHAFTGNPEQVTSQADIVVSDVGIPNTIRGHWLKPGAVVIDTGTNSVKDPEHASGYRLVGDVCYEEGGSHYSCTWWCWTGYHFHAPFQYARRCQTVLWLHLMSHWFTVVFTKVFRSLHGHYSSSTTSFTSLEKSRYLRQHSQKSTKTRNISTKIQPENWGLKLNLKG